MTWSVAAWPFARVHPTNGMPAPAPVHIAALERGADRDRYGFFLEQGLAKTVADFARFLYNLHLDKVAAHLVVAPSYLKHNWADEAALWSLPVPLYTWPTLVPEKHFGLGDKPFIYVINPEALLYSGGAYVERTLFKKIPAKKWSITIDECTMIKNFNGTLSKRIRELFTDTIIRSGLSGTPMTQNVMDLYAQLRWLGELNGVNPYQFRNRHGAMGGFRGRKVVGYKREGEIHRLLDHCAFRALKKDWWEGMPEKVYMSLEFDMTTEQWNAYQTMLTEFYAEIRDDTILANQVIHAKRKLQQISRGFIIDTENESRIIELVPPAKNPAIRVVKQWIENTPGKVIVAAFHRYSVAMLAEALQEYGVCVMKGGMGADDIQSAKVQFNNSNDHKVLVGQSSVTAKGHTLLGTEEERCSNTLFFENDYNLETRMQLEDRNHRFGQRENMVGYTDLYCGPEDKIIVEALQAKADMVEAIVNAVRHYPVIQR